MRGHGSYDPLLKAAISMELVNHKGLKRKLDRRVPTGGGAGSDRGAVRRRAGMPRYSGYQSGAMVTIRHRDRAWNWVGSRGPYTNLETARAVKGTLG
jgi:hypothetical protein